MRRLLITGGAGFIGANFTRYWARERPNDRIVVLDALTYAGNLASLSFLDGSDHIRFVHGDIRNFDLVRDLMESEKIDTVVHFAAESHVDRSIHGPGEFISTNVVGTQILLDGAREVWRNSTKPAHRFHHVSTDEVFGSLEPDDAPFHETTPYSPRSPYAASKAAADHIVRAYGHTYGLPYTLSNCSNNYGPFQFPEKLLPLCILNLLEGRPLPIYGDGSNVRDWLFVEDHCRALRLILDDSPPGETWNVGGESECSYLDLIRMLCDLVDATFARDASLADRFPQCPPARAGSCSDLITFVPDRPGHDRRYAIDATRLRQRLGFRPQTTLATGLQRTIDWYLANESWWRSIVSGEYKKWIDKQYGTLDPADDR